MIYFQCARYKNLATEKDGLFLTFSELTADTLRPFINEFGPLRSDHTNEVDWLREIDEMRSLVALGFIDLEPGNERMFVGVEDFRDRVNLKLLDCSYKVQIPGKQHGPWKVLLKNKSITTEGRPLVIPVDLASLLWFQLAHSGDAYVQCPVCGAWFESGKIVAKSGKRFCSNACRQKDHRRRQTTAMRMHYDGASLKVIATAIATSEETVARWLGVTDDA